MSKRKRWLSVRLAGSGITCVRSNDTGFLMPLGADSSSVAANVGCMYQIVIKGLNHLTVHTLARIKRH